MPNLPNSAEVSLSSLVARRRSLFWRIHFWAALIASPFALLAALSGILYIFTPQLERALYSHLDQVVPTGVVRPLGAAIEAARKAAPPGAILKSVVPAFDTSDSVKIFFAQADAHQMHMSAGEHAMHSNPSANKTKSSPPNRSPGIVVYVNPYTATVLGTQLDNERFGSWSKKLHSSFLQGDGWRWMIELAASWLMVMLLTGIYLWWPRNRQSGLPQRSAQGRSAWSQWHGFIGVALSVMSFVVLTTGLTWSKYAGDQIRFLRDHTGQASPQAPRDIQSTVSAAHAPMTWQEAADVAKQKAPAIALQLTPPRNDRDIWRINNYDRSQPEKRVDMLLDAYNGKTLFYAGWQEQTAFAKATGIGIPFHRGEFGLWNQMLLLVFGSGIMFSLISGWIMFFKRRKAGTWGLPKLLPGAWKSMPIAAWLCAAIMCMVMPLLALSTTFVLILEMTLHLQKRTAPG